MKLLLDTYSFLWFIMGSPKLSEKARALIEDRSNEKLFSIASLWEMAIKLSLGKLSLAQPFDVLIPQQLSINGIGLLDIKMGHITVVSTLPFHHRDPFDRLLVGQSMFERLPVLSADPSFDAYPVDRLW
ncbi:MAG: twitching motility protein PilT [Nitrospinae bacterium RIFCSPLOWO2_12_FULL_45_22]|nr:MAG: twitching motility protein PilT [Nitrospinae bacterium RIFCSPLOWO2_12_FULL_45_22]